MIFGLPETNRARIAPGPTRNALAASRYLFTCTCMKLSFADVLTTRIVVPVFGTLTPDQPKWPIAGFGGDPVVRACR